MADALAAAKSLTPQRKHHKLLKDGTEVWSEDVEKVFVQGGSLAYCLVVPILIPPTFQASETIGNPPGLPILVVVVVGETSSW